MKDEKSSKKGGGKGKKKSFDVVQSSNPKQKYQQQRGVGGKGGRDGPSLVDQQHKQKAPLLVAVPETMDSLLLQPQDGSTTSFQAHVSIPHGQSERTTDLNSLKELVHSLRHEPLAVEDMEVDVSNKGDKQVLKTEVYSTNMLVTIDEHGKNEGENEHGEHQQFLSPEASQLQESTKQVCPQTAATHSLITMM